MLTCVLLYILLLTMFALEGAARSKPVCSSVHSGPRPAGAGLRGTLSSTFLHAEAWAVLRPMTMTITVQRGLQSWPVCCTVW
jgi:hypothetical protein